MKTRLPHRILSILLLAAMLISLLGSSLAFAVEIPGEETGIISQEEVPAQETEAACEEVTEDESVQQEELPEETPLDEGEPAQDAESTESEAAPVSEEPEADNQAQSEPAAKPTAYTYGGYEAPNIYADEVPDYFLDEDNWNVLDNSQPVLPVSDLSEEEQMAQANQELVSASVMTTSEGYDYEEELSKFPESYQDALEALHELYPNWIFIAVDTGLTWEEVIEGELGAASTIDYNLNNATHHLLLNNHSGYYSTSSYSSTNGYKPIDGRHVSCSRAAIAYYMDPRNFLMEKYIFQFEDQSYSSVQELSGVQKILKNADSSSTGLYHMTNYVTTSGSTATLASLNSDYGSDYSTIIYRSGMAAGVSPYYLASKIAQETGATTTNASISGTYSGYTGIYNFYNIGAYASTTGQAVANGLKYAKEHGWTNPILAVKGGADFLATSYIGKGQNTGYYMRFNVSPEAYYNTYTHQYMSATYAVAAEATSTLSGYKSAGALDSAFLFYIPVYDNMPDQDSTVSLTATTKGTTNASANLYTEPSTSSTNQVTIPSGAAVTVLGGSVTSSNVYIARLYYPYWYKVKVTVSGTSYTGYVREDLVDLSANYTLKAGATQSLSSIRSVSGNVGTIYYETSDPAVATVSDSGVITAVANGSCKIYAISTGGSFDAIGVKVSSSGSAGSSAVTELDTPALSGISNISGGVKLTWSSVDDATGYTVWRKTTGSWSKIATLSSGTTTSYTDTTTASGTTYTYTVRATCGSVVSSYDSKGLTTLYLDTPTLSSAFNVLAGVRVTWGAVSTGKGYTVWRKSTGSWSKIATISSASTTTYTDTTAKSGTSYTYTVRAISGDYTSSYVSSGVTCLKLDAPKLISATGSDTGITINWTAVTGASGYGIWRKVSGGSWTKIATVSSGTTLTYTDTSSALVTGTDYIYTVRAYSGSTWSWYYSAGVSAQITQSVDPSLTYTYYVVRQKIYYRTGPGTSYDSVGTLAAGKTVSIVDGWSKTANDLTWVKVKLDGKLYYVASDYLLATPTLKSAVNTNGGVQLTWGKISTGTGYTVWRKVSGGSWSKIATISSNSTVTCKDTTASSGTKYIYTVRATYGSVASRYNTAGITRLYLAVPELSSASVTSSSVKVSWKSVTGATGYTVWRKISGRSWSKIAAISSGSTTSYTDSSNLTSGTTYIYTVRATNGSTVSYYNTSGISAKYGSTSDTLVDYVARQSVNYRTGAGTSYSKAGSVSAGTVVKVVDGWSTTANGLTWMKMKLNGNTYYIASDYLLATPKLKSAVNVIGGVKITWDKVSTGTGYTVWRKVSGGSWSQIATISSGSTVTYTDKTASSGTAYIYTVRATYDSYASRYSTSGMSCTYLATPTLKSASASSSGITVTWGKVTGATGYTVWRRSGSSGWTRIAVISSGSTTSYTDSSSLTSGTKYIYTVRATKGSAASYYYYSGVSATASSSVTLVNYVTTGSINYRTGPGTSYALAGTFSPGTTVKVVEGESYDVNGTPWYRIYVSGSYYYISSRYLEKA